MTTDKNGGGEIALYQADDGKTWLEVHLDHETVWLTQKQMSELFAKTVPTINEHLKNILKEGELEEGPVIRNFRITAADGKFYDTAHYNLDVIIAVGYRVKSRRGTQFRQWATRVLRDHLVKGYTIHEQRLREETAKLRAMQQTVDLLARTLTTQELVTEAGKDVLRVIGDYAYALATLDRYDHGTLAIEATTGEALHVIDYDEGIALVRSMKGEFDGACSASRRTRDSRAPSAPSTRPSAARSFTRVGGQPALLRGQKPRLQRRQQAHRRRALHLFSRCQWHPLPPRRLQAPRRQRPGGADAADRREPSRRERDHRQSHRQPDQPMQRLNINQICGFARKLWRIGL
jgi:hypothetical protein